MTIKLTKSLSVNLISTDYGVPVGVEAKTCDLSYEVASVNIEGDKATATLSMTINEALTGASPVYSSAYNRDAGDVFSHAEDYLLSLEEFGLSSKV